MNKQQIEQIIHDIGHIRVGGTPEEKYTAEYLQHLCMDMGISAHTEQFDLPMYTVSNVRMIADGEEIPCTAYGFCGSGSVEAPLVYLPAIDTITLPLVKDKIVLIDTGTIRYFDYQDLVKNGALGIITYNGDIKWADNSIDQKELRDSSEHEKKILCVNISAQSAANLVKNQYQTIKIEIEQSEYMGCSWNTVAEIPGTSDEWIVLSAHLDSVPTAPGVWDNLSGCLGVLGILEACKAHAPYRYGIRALFCGCEEKGLLGSKAYVAQHKDALDKVRLNVNVDLIGSTMGNLMCILFGNADAWAFMRNYCKEVGQSVHFMEITASSDSAVFADHGIPAISFHNNAPQSQCAMHCPYDDGRTLMPERIIEHTRFIAGLVARLGNSVECPIDREVTEKDKEGLDKYFHRKRA